MPFIPALNTLRVNVGFLSSAGESGSNQFHFRNSNGAIANADVTALFDALDTFFGTYWANVASNQWQTDFYSAVDLTAAEGAAYTRVASHTGTRTSPALPAADTIAMSWRTGFSGRSRRGRTYHVGMTEDMVVHSTLQASPMAAMLSAYEELINLAVAADWQLVIASFRSNKQWRLTALLTPVTNVILTDVIVDSMDSRKPRSG